MNKFLLALMMTGLTAMAQSVISAKAGVVHYTEGEVTVNDEALVMKPNKFPELKKSDVLRTTEGRAEILLSPGALLRLGENSATRMISNSLLATKVALLDGTAIIEVLEMEKLASLEFVVGDDTISVRKPGLYRVEFNPPAIKVYDGEVAVNFRDELVKVGGGRIMTLTGDHLIARFDKKTNVDELVQWADQRSSAISMANMHSAKSMVQGYGTASSLSRSGWVFNPFYSMYTYVPFSNAYYSYFGYGFFSPSFAYAYYTRPVGEPSFANGMGGFGGDRSAGYNGGGGYFGGSASRGMGSMSGGGLGASGGGGVVSGGERAAGSAGAGGARGGGSSGGRGQ